MALNLLTGKATLHSLPPCDLSNCTKQDIKAYFENTYDLYETLFTSLKDESVLHERPEKLRLQLIFYYAHTAAVYINKFILAGLIQPSERINMVYETIFETGVNEMKWDEKGNFRISSASQSWPSVDKLVEYRRLVRELILKVIDRTPLTLPVTQESPWWAVFMGVEHDRIHLETSAVLIRQLPYGLTRQPQGWTDAPSSHGAGAGENELITVEGQEVILGKPREHPSYGWDNEYGRRKVSVPPFEASKYLTSNGEFVVFMEAGGYGERRHWSEEGWSWLNNNRARHPVFWSCGTDCDVNAPDSSACIKNCQKKQNNGYHTQHTYRYRAMFGVRDMPWDWPVETNYHEAKAYAAWRGDDYRMLCEAELHVISQKVTGEEDSEANCNMKYGSSTPVNMFPANHLGFHDTNGNVLHWTEDHFTGFPGFETSNLYGDFSTTEFDGNHHLILGSSWVTTGIATSRFYRTSFRRHFFQFCGFRLARSLPKSVGDNTRSTVILPVTVLKDAYLPRSASVRYVYSVEESASVHRQYDSEAFLNHMLSLEYGGGNDHFSAKLTQRVSTVIQKHGLSGRALHMGCGTGRLTFNLAKYFSQVVGQDVVGRLVEACMELQGGGNLTYTHFSGWQKSERTVSLSLEESKEADKVVFKELSWLPNEVGTLDFVLATNIDRLHNVQAWLIRFREIVADNGIVVVAAMQENGRPEKLQTLLGEWFELLGSEDLPLPGGDSVCLSTWKKTKAF